MKKNEKEPSIDFSKIRSSKDEGTPFILHMDTIYAVNGMTTRVPCRVNNYYPMLISRQHTVIETINKFTTLCQESGVSFSQANCSQRELDCFKEPILVFKLSLTDVREAGSVPEGATREENLFWFESTHDAQAEISLKSDQFANRIAASMGASMGKPTDGYKRLSELNLKESFGSMINRLTELREIESTCKAGKPSPRSKSI